MRRPRPSSHSSSSLVAARPIAFVHRPPPSASSPSPPSPPSPMENRVASIDAGRATDETLNHARGRAGFGRASDDVGARCVNVSSVSRYLGARCVNVSFGRALVRAPDRGRQTRARRGARGEARRRRYDSTRARGGLISLVSFVRRRRRRRGDRRPEDRSIGIRLRSSERVCVLVLSEGRGTKGDGADDGGDD